MTRPLARFGIVPMTKLLALGGHGIGPEILDQGLRVLDRVAGRIDTGTVYIKITSMLRRKVRRAATSSSVATGKTAGKGCVTSCRPNPFGCQLAPASRRHSEP